MVEYTITFKQDVYSITNNNSTDTLNLDLGILNECLGTSTSLVTVEIPVGDTYVLPLTNDGMYHLLFTDSGTTESEQATIRYYQNLQLALLQNMYNTLCTCECGCADCIDKSAKPCEELITTTVRTDSYLSLSNPRYESYIQVAFKSAACYTNPQLYCDIEQEWVTGNTTFNEKLTKQLLSLKYLGMYYQELAGLVDQEDIDYINKKFMSESILCCINKLGVDINKIKTDIEDTMGTMTINTGAYQNLPPTSGVNTVTTTNRTDYTFTVADFTTDTSPAYSDPEGTPCKAIRITSFSMDGVVKLNGVQVTDNTPISITDIEAGLLVFTPVNQDPIDTDMFTFDVQDSDNIWSTDI